MARKVLLGLAAVLVAGVVLVAVVLVPPHRQIRNVAVTIPTAAELDAVLAVTEASGPVAVSYVNTASRDGPGGSVSHTVAVLRWPDDRLFLIDAGMDRQAAEEFGETIRLLLDVGPVAAYGPVEQQMGERVHAVRGIGFTHLHIDHTSGITAFCAAQNDPATIFQTRPQATVHNLHTEEGRRLVESSACDREILDDETIATVPGFPGLAVIAAGGHTPGSSVFAAGIGGETWIFSGDLTNSLRAITQDRAKGFLYSYLLVPENVALLARWRQWLRAVDDEATHVIVAHDLESYRGNGVGPWATTR